MRGEKHLALNLLGAVLIMGVLLSGCSQTIDPCLGTEVHPIGVNIAANYQVDYAQVMDWYCGGNGFDDIILALETISLIPDLEIQDLLELIEKGESWDDIWNDLGLTN